MKRGRHRARGRRSRGRQPVDPRVMPLFPIAWGLLVGAVWLAGVVTAVAVPEPPVPVAVCAVST